MTELQIRNDEEDGQLEWATRESPYPVALSNADGTPAGAVVQGSLVDRSGTIASGGTAQVAMAANPNRRYLLIQNLAAEVLWISLTATATNSQPSIALKACTVANDGTGGAYVCEGSFIPTGALSVRAATTSSAFAAREG